MKPVKHHLPSRFLAALLLLCGPLCAAQPVTIANPGFETNGIAEGVLHEPVTSWEDGYYEVSNPGVWVPWAGTGVAGATNPDAAYGYGGTAYEGENVAWALSFTGFDQGLRQVLGATLQADATYNLSVRVGNPGGAAGNNGATPLAPFRIELVADNVILASSSGTVPAADTWAEATLGHATGASPAQLGKVLEIRLFVANFPTNEFRVNFDAVALTVALANPVALTGGPYALGASSSLSLNGSASLPSDGATIATYEWDLDNDGDYDEAITGATPAAIPFADLQATHGMGLGSNTIRLRVTDSAAKSATATTTVGLFDMPVDRFRSGGGAWDTSTLNWGSVSGGPYDTEPWSNTAPFIANLEGVGGTLTLASDMSLSGLDITAGTPRIITGNTLNFASGGILLDNGVNAALNTTIRSGITGSPVATANAGEILILDSQEGLIQTLGAVNMNCRVSGTADNRITLQGATSGNSTGDITVTTSDNAQRTNVEKRGSGTWTVGALKGAYNQRLRMFLYDNGRLIVNGAIYGTELNFASASATLELKQAGSLFTIPSPAPGSGRAPNNITSLQGTIDNSSGGLITLASNPSVTVSGNFTLSGKSMNFGTGNVGLGAAVRTVTIQDSATTMTLGGTVAGGRARAV